MDGLEEYYHLRPVIYATEDTWELYLNGYFDEYPLWIRNVVSEPAIEGTSTFWQYSNRGRLFPNIKIRRNKVALNKGKRKK